MQKWDGLLKYIGKMMNNFFWIRKIRPKPNHFLLSPSEGRLSAQLCQQNPFLSTLWEIKEGFFFSFDFKCKWVIIVLKSPCRSQSLQSRNFNFETFTSAKIMCCNLPWISQSFLFQMSKSRTVLKSWSWAYSEQFLILEFVLELTKIFKIKDITILR